MIGRVPDSPVVVPDNTVVARELPFFQSFTTPPLMVWGDWQDGMVVRRTWRTEILGSAVGDVEQRVARACRPVLGAGATHAGLSEEQAAWLMNMLYWASPQQIPQTGISALYTGVEAAASKQFYSWPYAILADEQDVAPPTFDGFTTATILLDTTCRRYSVGGRIWLYPSRPDKAFIVNPFGTQRLPAQLYTISALTPTSIQFQTTAAEFASIDFSEVARYLRAAPAFDAVPLENHGGGFVTCTKLRASLDVQEMEGQNQQPALNAGAVPAIYNLNLLGKPVFAPNHNWTTDLAFDYVRSTGTRPFGRGTVVVLSGPNARLKLEFSALADRQTWWDVAQFFDSRQGRCRSFWTVTDICLFKNITAPGGPTVSGLAQRGFDAFKDRQISGLAFFRADGTAEYCAVNGFIFNSGTGEFTANVVPDLPAGQYTRACLMPLSRFDSDTLEEEWLTCDLVESSFSIVEVFDEPVTLEI